MTFRNNGMGDGTKQSLAEIIENSTTKVYRVHTYDENGLRVHEDTWQGEIRKSGAMICTQRTREDKNSFSKKTWCGTDRIGMLRSNDDNNWVETVFFLRDGGIITYQANWTKTETGGLDLLSFS